MLRLKILCNLFVGGKYVSISCENIFATFVFTFKLKDGLNKMTFRVLYRVLLWGKFGFMYWTYRPYLPTVQKTPIDNFIINYINTSSNYTPQIIKHLTQTISERLSRNSSSAGILEQSKPDYEEALKQCSYKAKLKCIQPNLQQNNTRRRTRKIIWFNPPFSLNVKTNVTKMFLQLIDTHFPPADKLHKTVTFLKFVTAALKIYHKLLKNIIRKLHR